MPRTVRYSSFNLIGYTLAILFALSIVVPMGFVLISAFKEHSAIISQPLGLPSSWNFDNFTLAEERAGLLQAMLNTVLVVIVAQALNLFVAYLAAYAIARIRVAEAALVEGVFSLGFLIPAFAIIVPVFLLAADVGLLYEPAYLMTFYAVAQLPLSVVVLANAMKQIPQDFEDSAVIDGANRVQVIRHVFFPLTRSAVATVVILNFLYIWNEYLFALLFLLEAPSSWTLPLGLQQLDGQEVPKTMLMAGSVIISVPVIFLFFFFERFLTRGLTAGAVKG
ncbi:carbohydrate ABC transporter permease [bacterium]|nr:carbohydrate ABC transporter permease [bacterium]